MSDVSAGAFGGQSSGGGGGAAPANVDLLMRSGRRLEMLQRYAPELVNDSPAGALAMAEGPENDDTILRAASQTVGFANISRIKGELEEESPEVAFTMFSNLPEQMRGAIRGLGYEPPDRAQERRQGGRLFGSVPIVGDVAERVLDWGEIPGVGGALEEAQHFLGEGAEGVGAGVSTVLKPLDWAADQTTHLYRSWKYQEEEQAMGWNLAGYFSPSKFSEAWENTEESDNYIRPGHRRRAMRNVDGDERLYALAKATALNWTPEQIIEDFGFEPGSVEATSLMQDYQQVSGERSFREAVNEISVGQVSFGRTVAQDGFGLDDTDSGFGRLVSGTFDAGLLIAADPTLVLGRVSQGARFGRWAFRLENSADVERGFRHADLALLALRGREGSEVGRLRTAMGRVNPLEMRRGSQTLAWADRVSDAFRTGDYASLTRDVPSASTALGHMQNYHIRSGTEALSSPLGVVEYLQDREGLLAIAGTRLGGTSTRVQGLRLPAITRRDRAAMRGRNFMGQTIDAARFVGSTPEQVYGPAFRQVLAEAGNPRTLSREMARWLGSKTVGSTGRALSYLTSHTPYRDVLPLMGDDAIPEFQRLTNLGLFAGASRETLDQFTNAFAAGDRATRGALTETFLSMLFGATGIGDTPFARRFIGAHRRAFANDTEQRALRLVDASEADLLSIPDVRQFLAGTYDVNLTRMLFHNPGSAWIDAKLSQYWKPAVLLRLGFISRAAGEESLHFMLKHGPRTFAGAKGGEWVARAEESRLVRGELAAAEAAGRTDQVNRLRQRLSDLETGVAMGPVRAMLAGGDRMFTRLLESNRSDASAWRQRLSAKAERLDTTHTVSGLERLANEMSLWHSGMMGRIAQAAPGDLNRETIGRWMAERWNPYAIEANRHMLRDPVVARAFSEDIAGSSLMPWEYRGGIDESGAPVRRVSVGEFRNGTPITQEVALRRVPDSYRQLDRVLDDPSMYRSLYQRQRQVGMDDRPAAAATRNVLPRYVGDWGGDLAARMGYGDDVATLRSDLNDLWAHRRSTPRGPDAQGMGFESGEDALDFLRRRLDGDEQAVAVPDQAVVRALKELAEDAGVDINTARYMGLLSDPQAHMAAKRFTLYDSVRADDLITDADTLRRKVRHATRGRMARPDVYPQLRSSRLYARGETELARPTQEGISKIYVPLMPPDYTAALDDDFVDIATDRIVRIGGYSPAVAREIAINAKAAADEALIGSALSDISMRPLAAWGSADPRVADAVMAAAEETTGVRPTFGILEVPDEVVTRSTDDVLSMGVHSRANAENQITDYLVDDYRLRAARPTDHPRRQTTLEISDEEWDDVALDRATRNYRRGPAEGMTRRYSRDGERWLKHPPKEGPFHFIDVPDGTDPALARRVAAGRTDTEFIDEVFDEGRRVPVTEFGLAKSDRTARQLSVNWRDRFDPETMPGRVEEVDLAGLTSMQDEVNEGFVERHFRTPEEAEEARWAGAEPDDLPQVLRLPDGRMVLANGNHRAIAQSAREGRFRARVWDVTEEGETLAPGAHGIRPGRRRAVRIDDEAVSEHGMHRLPGRPAKGDQPYMVSNRSVSDGLGEIEALERAADRTTDEVLEVLTTTGIDSTPDDVLHEVVEPMLRGDRTTLDEAGNEHFEPGYNFEHLMRDTSADRLPTRSWGPEEVASRDLKWSRFVREFFDGPVNKAISSLIRKPMFATVYGEQLRNSRALAALFVDPPVRQAVVEAFERRGLPTDQIDEIAGDFVLDDVRRVEFIDEDDQRELLEAFNGGPLADEDFSDMQAAIHRYARQRHWGERHVSQNALNRAVQITTPFIDDSRVRSAFQGYVNNFIPFHFAEEQFLKRWARSVIESPEMIRKAQLTMSGFRSMGAVRRDEQGREVYTFPLVGDALEVMSKPIEWMTGGRMSIPYEIELTGDVGYTLPGFGDQMGVPSGGPLVGMGTEFLSRHFPELAEVEQVINQRGANRPLWQYLAPSQAGRMWEAAYGDIDKGQLHSATLQAMQTMIVNGQGPEENATPEQQQEFIERAKGQARFILFARGAFGMMSPASPQVEFEREEFSEEFLSYLQADVPFEESIQLFLGAHPEVEPADLLAATVFPTQTEASGLEMPTDEGLNWMQDNESLLQAYPDGASWLIPRADSEDQFSQRAYNEQLARGLRKRKTPQEFLNDIYFRTASQDYFRAREEIDAQLVGAEGSERSAIMSTWDAWKDGYYRQHPVFRDMLLNPERQQGRRHALEELTQLAGRNDELVPDDMRQLLSKWDDFQLNMAGLRGDRRQVVADMREELTGEFHAWAQWHIDRYPSLAGMYMRLIEPELVDLDEDGIVQVTR